MNVEEYQPEFGRIDLPAGFIAKLEGKTIEEQMAFYRITESTQLARTSYGQVDKEAITKSCYKLSEYKEISGLIEQDGILVGVRMNGYWDKNKAVLPYQCVLTYYASDNDGAGTNDREDYAYLICV